MKRRSPAQWRALFQKQQISGLSAAAFCRERKICPKYFSLRRRQLLGDGASGKTTTASPFVPVAVQRPAETLTLEVRWGDSLQLRIPPSVSPQWLTALVHALRN